MSSSYRYKDGIKSASVSPLHSKMQFLSKGTGINQKLYASKQLQNASSQAWNGHVKLIEYSLKDLEPA